MHDQGEHEKAIEKYKKAVEIDPNFLRTYYNLGLVYLNTGQKDEAIKSFQHVQELAPGTTLANEAKQSINKLTEKNE